MHWYTDKFIKTNIISVYLFIYNNSGKVESCSRIQDRNGKLREDEVPRIWKVYFEDLYNLDTQKQLAVHMCCFDGVLKGKYFGRE